MWKDYFKMIKLVPGRVVISGHGTVDFSRDDIPVELIKELYENDFPYLELTSRGKEKLYGFKKDTPKSTYSDPPSQNKPVQKRKRKKRSPGKTGRHLR
jgi:hypothetical protein